MVMIEIISFEGQELIPYYDYYDDLYFEMDEKIYNLILDTLLSKKPIDEKHYGEGV